jgi:hypothetical protein
MKLRMAQTGFLIELPKHESINGCPKKAGRCPKKISPTITQLAILRTTDERNRTRRQFIAQAARLWFPGGLCVS